MLPAESKGTGSGCRQWGEACSAVGHPRGGCCTSFLALCPHPRAWNESGHRQGMGSVPHPRIGLQPVENPHPHFGGPGLLILNTPQLRLLLPQNP